jgi:hypothetical protein
MKQISRGTEKFNLMKVPLGPEHPLWSNLRTKVGHLSGSELCHERPNALRQTTVGLVARRSFITSSAFIKRSRAELRENVMAVTS